MRIQIVSFLMLFLLSPGLQASWSEKSLALLNQDLPQQVKNYPDALITFWGGFRRFWHWAQNRGEILEKESALFRTGKFSFYLSVSPKPDAPLYLFMPGIYGQPHKGITQNFIDTLEALDGSVMVVSNLLGEDYIRSHPKYEIDVVESEVAVMQEALDFALSRFKTAPSKIHLIAESLGSSVAVAWVAQDQAKKKQISDLLLMWPPLHLYSAMKNFDSLIESYRSYECTTFGKLLTISQRFLFEVYPLNLTQTEVQCMGQVMLLDGFLKSTKRSLDAYQEVNPQLKELPAPTGFEHFFQNYRPEVWKLLTSKDPRLALDYWVAQYSQKLPVKVMTSHNDFLNKGLSWEHFAEKTKLKIGEDILILDWGGHSGSVGSPQFQEVLKTIYL